MRYHTIEHRGLDDNVWVAKIFCVHYKEYKVVEVHFRLNYSNWHLSKSEFKDYMGFNGETGGDVGFEIELDREMNDAELDNKTKEMGRKYAPQILDFLKTHMGRDDFSLFEFSQTFTENSLEVFLGDDGSGSGIPLASKSPGCVVITASPNSSEKIPFQLQKGGRDLDMNKIIIEVDIFTDTARVPIVHVKDPENRYFIAEMSLWAFERLQMQNGHIDEKWNAKWMQLKIPFEIKPTWEQYQ